MARNKTLFLFLTISLIGCFEQGDCTDVSGNVMQVNFYRASDKKALAIELDSVKLIGWDSVMYAADSLNTIKLPLDLAQQELSFILYHKTARIDTLQIKYEFQTIALAPQCNAIDLITLSKATSKTLPSVIINQPKITNNVAENIKLYF